MQLQPNHLAGFLLPLCAPGTLHAAQVLKPPILSALRFCPCSTRSAAQQAAEAQARHDTVVMGLGEKERRLQVTEGWSPSFGLSCACASQCWLMGLRQKAWHLQVTVCVVCYASQAGASISGLVNGTHGSAMHACQPQWPSPAACDHLLHLIPCCSNAIPLPTGRQGGAGQGTDGM